MAAGWSRNRRRPGTIWARLLLSAASLTLGLAAVEAAVRWRVGAPLLTAANLLETDLSMLASRVASEHDPMVGWAHRSNLCALPGEEHRFTTGPCGLRMNGPAITTPSSNAILAVGDSFTEGTGVVDSETWPALLEQRLGRPVLNAGTGGWGPDQIVLRAESLVPVLNPDTVAISFYIGGIERAGFSVFAGGAKPYFVLEGDGLGIRNQPVPVFRASAENIGLARAVFGRSAAANLIMRGFGAEWWFNPGSVTRVEHGDGLEVTCRLLRRFKGVTDAARARLVLVIQYAGEQLCGADEQPEDAKVLSRRAAELGIETVDLWQALRDVRDQKGEAGLRRLFLGGPRFWKREHMSPSGNALVADLLAERLRAGAAIAASAASE